jgi:hypothetical protein
VCQQQLLPQLQVQVALSHHALRISCQLLQLSHALHAAAEAADVQQEAAGAGQLSDQVSC